MADDREVVDMFHPEASPDTPVQVTRHEYESVWKTVGWKLRPTPKKESK